MLQPLPSRPSLTCYYDDPCALGLRGRLMLVMSVLLRRGGEEGVGLPLLPVGVVLAAR